MGLIASSSFPPFKLGLHLGRRALYFETQLWIQTLQNGGPIVDLSIDQLDWDSNWVGSQCKAPFTLWLKSIASQARVNKVKASGSVLPFRSGLAIEWQLTLGL
jgi:hypothetical protein